MQLYNDKISPISNCLNELDIHAYMRFYLLITPRSASIKLTDFLRQLNLLNW